MFLQDLMSVFIYSQIYRVTGNVHAGLDASSSDPVIAMDPRDLSYHRPLMRRVVQDSPIIVVRVSLGQDYPIENGVGMSPQMLVESHREDGHGRRFTAFP